MEEPGTGSNATRAPEGGISIARLGAEGDQLRRALERPAIIGRTLLLTLGAITAAAGIADLVSTRSVVGAGIAAFGAVLIALGLAQHFLHRRDIEHWPVDVILWGEGVELVLSNGEVRGAMWSDADFALQLISRKARPPAQHEYLLLWLPDSKIPASEISEEGFDRIVKATADAGLRVTIVRRGRRGATQFVQIKQAPPAPTTGMAKSSKLEG